MHKKILLLGGTTEARQVAEALAGYGKTLVTMSLAGRTKTPLKQPVPVRVGGFGGAAGLAIYLREHQIDLLIDATHPFAARISANAVLASEGTGVPLIAFRRPPWHPRDGDRWTSVDGPDEAFAALGEASRNVFLALGRVELGERRVPPQHSYLVRSIDPIHPPLQLPRVRYITARGPFDQALEEKLFKSNRINVIMAKNSGGAANFAKFAAARKLGIEVIMLRQPSLPKTLAGETVAEVCALAVHALSLVEERGA